MLQFWLLIIIAQFSPDGPTVRNKITKPRATRRLIYTGFDVCKKSEQFGVARLVWPTLYSDAIQWICVEVLIRFISGI